MPAPDLDAFLAAHATPADKSLAEKQGKVAVVGSAPSTDLDAFLQSNGVQTLPNGGKPGLIPTSTAEAVGNAAAQGATLGFGDELSAAVGALAPTQTDQALNRGYSDRYSSIRDTLRAANEATRKDHPYVSALTEIASSLPATIATAGLGQEALGLSGLSKIRQGANVAGLQGGLFGLGKSNKESVLKAATDTTAAAATSYLFAGGLGKVFKAIADNPGYGRDALGNALDDFGNIIESSKPPTVQPKGADVLKIDYSGGGQGKAAQELSKEMQMSLTNPVIQDSIKNELNAQPQQLQEVFDKVKPQLAAKYDGIVKQYGDTPTDVSDVFSKARDRLSKVFAKSDASVEKTKDALLSVINDHETNLVQQYGSLKNVPLSQLTALKQDVGNLVFEQGAFNKAGTNSVNAAAKSFWGGLTDSIQKNDPSGGQLGQIDKVYKAIYNMSDEMPTGENLLSLANPKSAAKNKFYDFLAHWAEVPPDVRSLYGQEIQQQLEGPMAKAIAKGQLMQAVDKVAGPELKALGIKTNSIKLRSMLGALQGKIGDSVELPQMGSLVPMQAREAVAPGLGSLMVDNNQPQQNNGALSPLK